MNTEINKSCKCFGLYDDSNIIGFIGVLHQPHPAYKNMKRVSRLVIIPDYQGIGLGTKFLDTIAKYYSDNGYVFDIVTSAKNMIYALSKSNNWICQRYSRCNMQGKTSTISKNKTIRTDCKTASFQFRKEVN